MLTTIGLEEHAWTPGLRDAVTALEGDARDDSVTMLNNGEVARRLLDVTGERIQHMDDAGIDIQVLSVTTPGTQSLPPAEAVRLARDANDMLAATVSAQPSRFAAFATLPTPDPATAAKELERTVRGLGFVGAMLFPRTGDLYLDHNTFRPVFEAAAGLGVPLYIHPEIAPHPVRDVYFSGFSDDINVILATGGWGWHADAGIAALRLILTGTFDRYPDLQLILGHWGEMLVFFLERADILSNWTPHLQRRVAGYITSNLNVTPAASSATGCWPTPLPPSEPTASCSPPTTPSNTAPTAAPGHFSTPPPSALRTKQKSDTRTPSASSACAEPGQRRTQRDEPAGWQLPASAAGTARPVQPGPGDLTPEHSDLMAENE
jgi:predicted TIM-barrel fold metal-dependent hydrolase